MPITTQDYQIDPGMPLRGLTLPQLFTGAVAEGGDRPAVTDGERSWSWRQWQVDVDALTAALHDLGVRPGDVVAVQLPNSWEFLVTHLAIAMAGGVMLPVHLGNGELELASLLRRADARVLVLPATRHDPRRRADVPHVVVSGPAPDSDTPTLAGLIAQWSGAECRPAPVRPDDPFVLLASSGTTAGRPKICLHSHDGLLSNAAAVAETAAPQDWDGTISASPFTHLFGLLAVHLCLTAVGRQILLPVWDVDRLLALAARTDPSVLFAVPAQLRDLTGRLAAGRVRLRSVRTGGAAVPSPLVADVRRLTGADVVVQWGMSELGAGLFTSVTDPPEAVSRSIGRPVAGAQVRVVDEDDRPCTTHQTGQLQVRSPYLFRGYLGDAPLTAAAYAGDGWLRTGDLASIDDDELVSFRGRVVELINVGGQKFSALEVEELLGDLPGIGPVAMVGRPDPRLGEYPSLVITPASATLSLETVTAYLRAKGVAEYKQPLELSIVDTLPLTPTGKLARRRLVAMLDERRPAAVGSTAGTHLDLVLDCAARVLGDAGSIVPQRTFRDCGLTSLGAVRLANQLAAAIDRPLPSTVVFDHPTPARLAAYLDELAAGRAALPATTQPDPPRDDDPVVIVGIGCRLPGGVHSPDDFWALLVDGRDAVTAFPTDRGWPDTGLYDPEPGRPGRTYCRRGGFLDGAADFDPAFFNITPTEAIAMDPQQRLLLEVCWEALEHAGIDPHALRDTDTGVFVGMMASDYAPRLTEAPQRFDGQLLIGNSSSVASGRVAYTLGLRGPAITLDTACSSALVALHQASRAIRHGDCDRALVGGVTVMTTLASFVDFSQQRVLAPDGRCKAFSAQADGAGWSEGVAVLVLERYSAARRDGHRVLGVIRGCAVNQDGASNGLTAPSGPAQEDVIRRALADAGLRGDEIDAVEAHGTGTRLGDPIEARALAAVYGSDRVPGNALWLGSVKSNIGHTQAAAGAVGVVKMLLALHHGVLPRTLHIDQATSHVDWSAGTVRLLVDAVDWRPRDRPRRAGVSAFGISGTNAHVILEEPPADDPPPAATGREHPPVPWVLSAASPQALRATAARLRAAVDGMRPQDVGYTLARTRARLRYRAVALPDGDGDHRPALDALATGTDSPDAVSGEAGAVGRTVFVFPGQGAQWAGMARDLLATAPAFAATIAACAEAFAPHLDWSLPDVLRGAPSAPSLDRVDVVQPALFSVMVALATLWRSHGVYPDAVIGHSQGEVAAAYVAGALSLPDAARIVAVRSRLLRTLAGRGAMASVPLPAHQVAGRLRQAAGRVSVAAVNGPRTTVISGAPDAVAELVAMLHAEHVPARPVPIEVAAHCAQVDELTPRLQQALAGITPRIGDVPFFSTVDGEWLDTAGLTAGYWCRNLRETVNFHSATRNLATQKYRYFIEVSPHPVLTTAMEQTLDDLPDGGIPIATLHSDDGGLPRFLRALAQAEVCGAAVDPTALFPTGTARRVDLPTYPFQHSRFWAPTATWTPPASTGENSPVPARVAGLNSEQTAAALLALVRTQAAAVTGFPDGQHIDAARTLQEQGFSSLAITELRARLSRATGLRLPAALTLDHPTPAALSRYLAQHLQPSPRPPAPGQSPESGNLESLLRQASAGGRIVAGLEMLKAASLIRPQFTATEPPEVQPVPVAHGPGRPMLVCLASLTPLSSPTEYASWRNTFDEIRDVVALPQPGFAQAQPLPRDLDAVLAAHSAAVTRIAGSKPYLLCGHSSGGWIAHATAGYLAGHGRPPTGVVLLDSYWPDASFHQHVLPKVLSHLIDAAGPDLGTARLTATGGYLRIMADWTPTRLDMPTLHIQARDPMLPGLPPPRWHLPHDAAVVDGTHLTMTTGHDDQVTKVVEEWINH